MSDFLIQDNILMKYTGSDSEVVITDGVTTIMDHAFYGCIQLKKFLSNRV